MTSELVIRPAVTAADHNTVQTLCWEYRAYLEAFSGEMRETVSLAYPKEAYAELIAQLPEKHARPKGIILLAELRGRVIGCGMSHPLNDRDTEVKRVFVRAEARGTGAGRAISQALIDQARSDGFSRILLDTSRQFEGPQKLYESLGFKSRGPYSDLPPDFVQLLVFYELTL